MAGKPIELKFVADVASYLREVKKVEVSTEDIADALVGVSHDAQDLEKKLDRAMRDAAKDTEVLERAIKDIPKATDKAADQAGRDFHEIGDEARDAGQEVGDEFKQNLGESLSSGDLSGLVQDTLGGLVASLKGPVGLAGAGVAAVAAIAFGQIRKNWEETNAAIAAQTESMWSTIVDSVAGKIGDSFAKVNKETLVATELHRLWSEEPEGMAELVESAKELGINAWDVTRARAGDEDALKRVKAAMDDVYETQNATGTATKEQIEAVQNIEGAWYKAETATAKTKAQVDAYNDSVLTSRQSVANLKADLETIDRTTYSPKIRLDMSSQQLQQLFPYGTVGGTSVYNKDKKAQ